MCPTKSISSTQAISRLDQLIQRAIDRRQALFSSLPLLRVFDGAGDGLDGLYVDRLGPCCVIHSRLQLDGLNRALVEIGEILKTRCAVQTVYFWNHQRQSSQRLRAGNVILIVRIREPPRPLIG